MGSYVALEGGDGTGKSTVAAALVASLEGRGETVTQVREPGGTALGEVVRTLLLDSESVEPWAEVMLFAAQRAELAGEVIRPALARGDWVVSDRTYYSSIAYQGRARGLGEETVRQVNEIALEGTVPDWVFVLDIEPAAGLERQDDPDRIGKEGVVFQATVRAAYQALAEQEPGKVMILDATRPVDELVRSIMARLDVG